MLECIACAINTSLLGYLLNNAAVFSRILIKWFVVQNYALSTCICSGLGAPPIRHESKIKASVENAFLQYKTNVLFLHLTHFSCSKKEVLPDSFLSFVVINFLCHCNSRYIGRISQRLDDRIHQHVPKFIRTGQIFNSRTTSIRFGKICNPVTVNPRLVNTF